MEKIELPSSNIPFDSFSDICRTCLTKNEVRDITEQFYEDKSILDLLECCVGIEITLKSMPQNMCQNCVDDLIKAYVFISKSRENDDLLHYIISLNSDIKVDIPDNEYINIKEEEDGLFDASILDDVNVDQEFKELFPRFAGEIEETLKSRRLNNEKPPDAAMFDFDSDGDRDAKEELNEFLQFTQNVQPSESSGDEFSPRGSSKTRTKGVLQCKFCDLDFKTTGEYRNHLVASKHVRGICDVCGYLVQGRETLRQHMIFHSDVKPFKCEMCNRSFYRKNHYVRHCNTHFGQRPFICSVCGKGYSTNLALTAHKNSHTGTTARICCYCGATFAGQIGYTQHMKTHEHSASFSCDECGKVCPSKNSLDSHKRIHTEKYQEMLQKPRKCKDCLMVFPNLSELRKHFRVHKTKHIECNICEKMFFSQAYLVQHMRTHSGEAARTCPFCNKQFFSIIKYKKHCEKCSLGQDQEHDELIENIEGNM